MTFGWTFEHIDEFVTLPQLKEMSEYWAKNPPLHWRGLKSSPVKGGGISADDAAPDFFRDFVAAGGSLPGDLEGVS
jgi:hypothetical protein